MLLALAAMSLSLFANPGRAGDEQVAFCFNQWAPSMYVQDGKLQGLSVQVLAEAARRAGLKAVYHERP
jgi:hypothetical protein